MHSRKSLFPFISFLLCSCGAASLAAAPAPQCSRDKVIEILAETTQGPNRTYVNCSLTLKSTHAVTKKLIFDIRSSNVHVDCNSATVGEIEVRGAPLVDGQTQDAGPHDITVRGCNVVGSIRVGEMQPLELRKAMSRKPGFVQHLRQAAPKNIKFENMTITSQRYTHLYVEEGATHVQLLNSKIRGVPSGGGPAIYLDHESTRNVIKGNDFQIPQGNRREIISVDASDYNTIVDNYFSGLSEGGIYLYRNCGEYGVSRWTTPSHNQIINNVFYYKHYSGSNPAVYVGSRQGKPGYCGDDSDSDYGSGQDDRDYARYNVVMQNQIYKRAVKEMIRVGSSTDSPNYIGHNTTVTTPISRLAGCHVANGYFKDFISHGESIEVFRRSLNGAPTCTGGRYTCNDGQPTVSPATGCSISKVDAGCQVSRNSSGCRKTASCPSGTRIIGAVAACNLEYGTVAPSTLDQVPINLIRVVKPSDVTSNGRCFVGASNLSSGETSISGVTGLSTVSFSCHEHDSNGGDCHIRGALYCR